MNEAVKKRNTRIEYLYRDASNYKCYKEFVVQGTFSSDEILEILRCLDMGEYFIPAQVGMPGDIDWEWSDQDDHPWFELSPFGFHETDEMPCGMSAAELLDNFRKAKNNWKVA